jgi:hypothetical protein
VIEAIVVHARAGRAAGFGDGPSRAGYVDMPLSRLCMLSVVSVLVLAACESAAVAPYSGKTSSSKDTGDENTDDTGDTTTDDPADTTTAPKKAAPSTKDGGASEPTATSATVTADQVPPAGECATAGATRSLCVACCLGAQLGGAQPGANGANAFTDCACKSPGVCAAACGVSYCTGKQPSATCNTCLEGKALQCEDAAMGGGGRFSVETMQCLVTCF